MFLPSNLPVNHGLKTAETATLSWILPATFRWNGKSRKRKHIGTGREMLADRPRWGLTVVSYKKPYLPATRFNRSTPLLFLSNLSYTPGAASLLLRANSTLSACELYRGSKVLTQPQHIYSPIHCRDGGCRPIDSHYRMGGLSLAGSHGSYHAVTRTLSCDSRYPTVCENTTGLEDRSGRCLHRARACKLMVSHRTHGVRSPLTLVNSAKLSSTGLL